MRAARGMPERARSVPLEDVPRWTRNAEFLIYLVPVGTISAELYDGYVRLLQMHRALAIRSLTRPGGYQYASDLSPFRAFSWDGDGVVRFHLVSTMDRLETLMEGEEVHACYRPIGVLGLCHCPTTAHLPTAYAQFQQSIARFPGLLVRKCFAFEHPFDVDSVEECTALSELVMFPALQELDDGWSTVRVHLQVVLDAICVTILMTLEGTVRAALRQQAPVGWQELDATTSLLLDTNVEPTPPLEASLSMNNTALALSSETTPNRVSSAASGGGAGTSASASDPRSRRRQIGRQHKLIGDYAMMIGCTSDALGHYATALEVLREEDRKSGTPADALWLAATLEANVFALIHDAKDQLVSEIVEKATEAVALYARARVCALELLLIEHLGWYYARVAIQNAPPRVVGSDKVAESVWLKRLVWDCIERGLVVSPSISMPHQLHFVIQASRMCEALRHYRRMALLLHDAASMLLLPANRVASPTTSPNSAMSPRARASDLQVALRLQQVAAAQLGLRVVSPPVLVEDFEVTSLWRAHPSPAKTADLPWLVVRFHMWRQMLTIAIASADALWTGHCALELLRILCGCDQLARKFGDAPGTVATTRHAVWPRLERAQQPSTLQRAPRSSSGTAAFFSSASCAPPTSVDAKTRRYFLAMATTQNSSPSSSSSFTASASFASTPQRLVSTPRQQISAAVNVISTKTSPSLAHGSNAMPSPLTPHTIKAVDAPSPASLFASSRESNGNEWLGGVARAWNLQSMSVILLLERDVLNLFEAQCTVLPPSEQARLSSIVRVDRVRLVFSRTECIVTQERARKRWDGSATATQASTNAFFYNPFDHNKSKNKTAVCSTDDTDENEQYQPLHDDAEHAFCIHETIRIQVEVSNPLGIPIDVQQLVLWVTDASSLNEMSSTEMLPPVSDAAVETYPRALMLQASERRKRVILAMRIRNAGTYLIRGCVLKLRNVRTTCQLALPVSVQVLDVLPRIALELQPRDADSEVAVESGAEPQSYDLDPLCLLAGEQRVCLLRIRNDGRCSIGKLHVQAKVKHGAVSSGLVLFSNTDIDGTSHGASAHLNTDHLSMQSLVDVTEVVGMLPLESGDQLVLPLRVSLPAARRAATDKAGASLLSIEITVICIERIDQAPEGSTQVPSFCREATLELPLVVLPSLMLVSARVLSSPTTYEVVTARFTDCPSCLVVLEVVNPTEMVFVLRATASTIISSTNECEIELRRQCARCVVLEMPRLTSEHCQDDRSLADLLNSLIQLEWRSLSGAQGVLKVQDSQWMPAQAEQNRLHLVEAGVTFNVTMRVDEQEQEVRCNGVNAFESLPVETKTTVAPASWLAMAPAAVVPAVCAHRLKPYEIHVHVQARQASWRHAADLGIEILVRSIDASGSSRSDDMMHVLVSGKSHHVVQMPTAESESKRDDDEVLTVPLRCIFLVDGRYEVTARGCWHDHSSDGSAEEADVVWCHRPLILQVGS